MMIANSNTLSLHVIRRNIIPASLSAHKAAARALHQPFVDPNSDPASALSNHRSDHRLTQTR